MDGLRRRLRALLGRVHPRALWARLRVWRPEWWLRHQLEVERRKQREEEACARSWARMRDKAPQEQHIHACRAHKHRENARRLRNQLRGVPA